MPRPSFRERLRAAVDDAARRHPHQRSRWTWPGGQFDAPWALGDGPKLRLASRFDLARMGHASIRLYMALERLRGAMPPGSWRPEPGIVAQAAQEAGLPVKAAYRALARLRALGAVQGDVVRRQHFAPERGGFVWATHLSLEVHGTWTWPAGDEWPSVYLPAAALDLVPAIAAHGGSRRRAGRKSRWETGAAAATGNQPLEVAKMGTKDLTNSNTTRLPSLKEGAAPEDGRRAAPRGPEEGREDGHGPTVPAACAAERLSPGGADAVMSELLLPLDLVASQRTAPPRRPSSCAYLPAEVQPPIVRAFASSTEGQPAASKPGHLARAYARAAKRVTGEESHWRFAQPSPKGKSFAALLAGAAALEEAGITPEEWAQWYLQMAKDKGWARTPGLSQVFAAKTIARWRGWCRATGAKEQNQVEVDDVAREQLWRQREAVMLNRGMSQEGALARLPADYAAMRRGEIASGYPDPGTFAPTRTGARRGR